MAVRGLGHAAVAATVVDGLWAHSPPHHLLADLSGLTLVDPEAVQILVDGLQAIVGNDRYFCLVSRRLSGRRFLRRFGPAGLPVFASISDALQARVHHEQGFGAGWEALERPSRRPSTRRRQRPDGRPTRQKNSESAGSPSLAGSEAAFG